METRETSAVSVEERIITFARERFRQNGFVRTSVDSLCSSMGISKKTFYKHFSGKEALVDAIISRFLSDAERGVTGIIYGDLPFVEKVNRIMQFMGETFRRIDRRFLQDIEVQAPQVWERIQAFRRERILKNFAGLITEGQRQGTIRPLVNSRVFILAYLASIESVLVPSVLADESFSADEALRSLMTVFFNGVLTEDAGRELHRLQQLSLHQEQP
jgi:AcrR family transcriptional regulator